jgi:tetratricopeptide (TPR) repeat protein
VYVSELTKTQLHLKAAIRKGIDLWLDDDYEGALRHFESVRDFFDESEPVYLRHYYMDLALVYRALGQYDLAIEENRKGLAIRPHEGHEFLDVASIKANLGYVLTCLERFDEAHGYYTEAEKYFESIYDYANLGEVRELRARAFLAQGLREKAEIAAQEAYDLLRSYSDAKAAQRAHRTLGMCIKHENA